MTIAKTKAAEMAYKKVNALRSQMMQTDFNPADDYKGTLMQRPQRRIIKNQQKLKSKSEQIYSTYSGTRNDSRIKQ